LAKQNAAAEAGKRKEAAKLAARKAYLEKQAMNATDDSKKTELDAKIAEVDKKMKAEQQAAKDFKTKQALIAEYQGNMQVSSDLAKLLSGDAKASNMMAEELKQ